MSILDEDEYSEQRGECQRFLQNLSFPQGAKNEYAYTREEQNYIVSNKSLEFGSQSGRDKCYIDR